MPAPRHAAFLLVALASLPAPAYAQFEDALGKMKDAAESVADSTKKAPTTKTDDSGYTGSDEEDDRSRTGGGGFFEENPGGEGRTWYESLPAYLGRDQSGRHWYRDGQGDYVGDSPEEVYEQEPPGGEAGGTQRRGAPRRLQAGTAPAGLTPPSGRFSSRGPSPSPSTAKPGAERKGVERPSGTGENRTGSAETQKGMAKAAGMASAMKASMTGPDGLAGGGQGQMGSLGRGFAGGGAAGPAARTAGASGPARPRGSSDPANPQTENDLYLAAGPYKDAFIRAGVVAVHNPPGISRAGGGAAGPDDLARLRAEIRSDPSALARNPGYFSSGEAGLSREEFLRLKDHYRQDPSLREKDFKDISLEPPEEERDFKRSASCEKASGECNPHAETSYSKDDDVPPEELEKILQSIEDYLAGEPEAPRPPERSGGPAAGRIKRLLSAGLEFLGASQADEEILGGADQAAGGESRTAAGSPGTGGKASAAARARRASGRETGERRLGAQPRGMSVFLKIACGLGAALLVCGALLLGRKKNP